MATDYTKRSKEDFNIWRLMFQKFIVSCVFYPFFWLFYRVEVRGKENIPKNTSFIMAAIHLSNFDPPLLAATIGIPVAFMAKKELFEVPGIKTMIDWLGAFSVNREKLGLATIKTAKNVMATKRWTLSMFPQGNRQAPGKITKINQGFAYLAKASKVGILPVAVLGSDNENKKFIPFKGKIIVKIGKPLPVPTDIETSMDEWGKAISELTGFEYTKNNCDGFSNKDS